MIGRRELLRVAGAAALAAVSGGLASCAAAPPPPRRYRIGFVALAPFDEDPDGGTAFLWKAFVSGLAENGYIDGQNVEIILRDAGGDIGKLPQVAADVAALQPDVIVGGQGPASRETAKVIKTIPVISHGPDLVKEGLVSSYSRPDGNVTGIVFTPADYAKNVELLREMFPAAKRVGAIWWTLQEGQTLGLKRAEEVAPSFGLQIVRFEVRAAADLAGAFEAAKRAPVDALLNLASPLTLLKRKVVVRLAEQAGIPMLYEQRAFVDDGGLASFGPDQIALWKRASAYAAKILSGARPADLPLELPTRLQLVLNLRAAKAIGVTIPQSVVARADDVLR